MTNKDDEIIEDSPSRVLKRVTSNAAGLVVEPEEKTPEKDLFESQINSYLDQTEKEVASAVGSPDQARAWGRAREIVTKFQPVPWFIWRLSNYVFSTRGQTNKIPEGLALGLRRLLFAAASDKVMGTGTKVNDVRRALKELPSDVVAACSVIHAVSRRLHTKQFERIWKPILEDAILRCHIGFFVGQADASFGPGRGMLAGFSGRSGLAILISTGEIHQARDALDSLSKGISISEAGLAIYGVDPLQVSAMTLSAAGCGREAAYGTVGYAAGQGSSVLLNEEQKKWLAAFSITEAVRTGKMSDVSEELWNVLGFQEEQDKKDLSALVKSLVRKGHGWNWLM